MDHHLLLWWIFWILAFFVFAVDFKLSVLKPHDIGLKESLKLCSYWVLIAIIYGLTVGYFLSASKMFEYFTAYIVEYSLSVDNMFVFLMIFSFFGVEKKYQAKVLMIGILSAIIMRMIFIFIGVELVIRFKWILYVFGVILLYSGYKMYVSKEEEVHPEKNVVLKLMEKFIPIDREYKGDKFFIKKNGKIFMTTMVAVLVMIETTDIIFAVDSIPAVLSISHDRLVVYSSNIFAVIGLRSLYFALNALNDYFIYLKKGVSVVLFYIGIKMLVSDLYHIPSYISLSVVIFILGLSILLSVIKNKSSK